MNPPPELLVIIPAFNEQESIAHTLGGIREVLPAVPVLVIDDGSSDETTRVARAEGARVITLPCHLGLGGSVQTGYKYAFEAGFEYVIRMDADGQHDPSDVRRILETLQSRQCPVVLGSRFVGQVWEAGSGPRAVGIRLFRILLRPILGRWVYDPTSGFVGVNRAALQVFSQTFPLEYPEIEMLVVLQRKTFDFVEISCNMRPRYAGKSTLTAVASFYYLVHVLLGVMTNVIRWPFRRRQRG